MGRRGGLCHPLDIHRNRDLIPRQANGATATADFDNDGLLDLALVGSNILQVIWRTGSAASVMPISSNGASPATVDVADYDNDGWLDLLVAGSSSEGATTRLFHNLGGTNFIQIGVPLAGISRGNVRWGDYDLDGRKDILIAGDSSNGPITRIYRNMGNGEFVDIKADLPAYQEAAAAWCDFNRDGYLDVTLVGRNGPPGSELVCRVFRGDAHGTFTASASNIGMRSASLEWGDYNNDGFPDLLMAGLSPNGLPIVRLLRNSLGTSLRDALTTFVPYNPDVVRWGDFDADGWPDILLIGQRTLPSAPSSSMSAVLLNRRNGFFDELRFPLPELTKTSGAVGDFDADGRLDFYMTGQSRTGAVSFLARNVTLLSNTPPNVVTSLVAVVSNKNVRLSWGPGSDLQSPAAGLSYSVRVTALPEEVDVISPSAARTVFAASFSQGRMEPLRSVKFQGWRPASIRGAFRQWMVHLEDRRLRRM